MSSKKSTHVSEFAGRLKELEHFTGSLVPRLDPDPEPEAEVVRAPRLVPVPRRTKIFLRHGDGPGVFAEMTLTAPHPRTSTD